METKLVVAASMICQLAAALAAIGLIRITRRWTGWVLIALAMTLQAARRGIVFYVAVSHGHGAAVQRLNDISGLLISVILLLGVLWLVPMFRSLFKGEVDLREANRKLLTVREDERRVLARELHDSLGHRIFALQLELERAAAAAPKTACCSEPLARSTRQCGAVMDEVRRICHGLYPPTLEALGLAETLRQLASELRSSVRLEVCFGNGVDGIRFPREVEIACFRVAQEAITNAARHGGANAMTLTLSFDDGILILAIEDNGSGFRPEETPGKGLGLANMRTRINALGGDVHIFSRPGSTQIVALLPTAIKGGVPT